MQSDMTHENASKEKKGHKMVRSRRTKNINKYNNAILT